MWCVVSASARGLLPVWEQGVERVGFGAGHHVAGSCRDRTLLSQAAVASLPQHSAAKLCKISLYLRLIPWTGCLALVEMCFQLSEPSCLGVNYSYVYCKNSIVQVQVI